MDYYLKSFIVRATFGLSMLIPFLVFLALSFYFGSVILCKYHYDKVSTKPIPPISFPQKGLITLWFDNAYLSQASDTVLKAMEENGFVGVISIPERQICTKHYLSWRQIQNLQNTGWETTLAYRCQENKNTNKNIVLQELQASKKSLLLRGLSANNITISCSYDDPFFKKNAPLLAHYYLSSRWLESGINTLPVTHTFNLKAKLVSYKTKEQDIDGWLKTTRLENGWLILIFNQIDDEQLDGHLGIHKFKSILASIKQSQIPVVLPTQALRL